MQAFREPFFFELCSACGFFELTVIQLGIESVLGKEFFVVSLFYDISVFHNKYYVCVAYRGQAVSDDETGSSFHQGIHRFLYLYLGSGINRAGRLIEYQYLRVSKDGSGNRQKLFLPL